VTALYVMLLILLIATGVVVLCVRAARRPFKNVGPEGVRSFLAGLLKRGHDGAFVVFTEPSTGRFLQFVKRVGPGRTLGITLKFPTAPWSREYVEPLKALLRRRGVVYALTPVPTPPTTEFIDVDCGDDVEMAAGLIADVFGAVFGRGDAPLLHVKTWNISPRDEWVDE
jgi:hypothetical protein